MKKFGEEHYRHTAYFNFEASHNRRDIGYQTAPQTAIIFSGKELSSIKTTDSSPRIMNIPLPLIDWLPKLLEL